MRRLINLAVQEQAIDSTRVNRCFEGSLERFRCYVLRDHWRRWHDNSCCLFMAISIFALLSWHHVPDAIAIQISMTVLISALFIYTIKAAFSRHANS
jgi:hypothetical protein